MQSAAYQRARKLLDSHPHPRAVAQILGVVQALLLLGILIVAGLFLALITTHGGFQYSQLESSTSARESERTASKSPPSWLMSRMPAQIESDFRVTETGVYPVVANNWNSPYLPHRIGARAVEDLLRVAPSLRSNRSALLTLLAAALALLLSASIVTQARRAAAVEASGHAARMLRHQIHRQMYRLGRSAMPTEGLGPLSRLFGEEVNLVREGLFADLEYGLRAPILAFVLLATALFISLPLTLTLLALGGVVYMTSRPMNRRSRQVAEVAARDASLQMSLLNEDLGLLRTVRVFGMEAVDHQRFEGHLERHQSSDFRHVLDDSRFSPTAVLLFITAMTLAAGLLGFVVLDRRLSIAAVAILVLALLGLAKPVADWLRMRTAVLRAARAAGSLFEFLEHRPELLQTVGAQFLPPMKKRISFENVTVVSPSGRTLLDGLSLEIPAQGRLAVMGRDEDSKHVLACLIPRLLDPKIGRVRIDGVDLREVTLESIRAQVATVFQSDLVLSDSVIANIGLGDASFGLPRIIEAAKIAHAHHFIQDLPNGYDTIIGPLGHFLRVDEQYRVALARAYLHDPSIVIIEEPNVAMDEDTKHLIDDTVARISHGRTVIFLPHRLSTIRSCDQVVVLHNGKVEALGPPRDLQGSSKLYRHLQYVEFNQFATGEIEAGQMNG